METSEYLRSLKWRTAFVQRRYSDHGKTFVGNEKWLKQVVRDEKVQDYLAHINIKWQFNLSHAA